ncbi:hypothetical protein [uncultured Dialister sp.]|uniref:hypothetical protein n=1 Tax=uncultured Dialister sp. TaxID=278064 RepID=UPI0027DB0227|nr:hypothetical protein [uncultured Dialister sp.]
MGKAKTAASWIQQPGETAKQFEAFQEYYTMPAGERSLAKVGKRLGKSTALMERWSSKNHWVERARNHDKELARMAYEEEARKVKAMAARHAKLGLALQNKGIMALNDVKKEEIDLKSILLYIRQGVALERQGFFSNLAELNREYREMDSGADDEDTGDTGPVIITGEDEIKD